MASVQIDINHLYTSDIATLVNSRTFCEAALPERESKSCRYERISEDRSAIVRSFVNHRICAAIFSTGEQLAIAASHLDSGRPH
jgi:hypothetical protein